MQSSSSSSFIDDLSPREKRYDLEIDPNLFISVLPNGVKTWVLCDMVLGKPRRKTLGIYPEMSLSDARDTVERVAKVGQHPEPLAIPDQPMPVKSPASAPSLTIRDGRIVPAGSSRWPLIAAAIAGLAVIVTAAFFWMRGGSEAVDAPSPTTATISPLAETQDATAAVEPLIDPPPAPAQEPAQVKTEALAQNAADAEETVALSETDDSPDFSEASTTIDAVTQQAAAETVREPAVETPPETTDEDNGAIDTGQAGTPVPAEPASQADIAETTADEPAEPPPAAANSQTAGAVTDIPQTPAPPRGVARFQLTSEISAREPTDDLQQVVNGGGADLRRVYFFTDLRGLTGESVTHRWLYNGELSAAVVFEVRGWRWRVYSSKDLLPGQAGDWTIEVVGSAGELLASHTFAYLP